MNTLALNYYVERSEYESFGGGDGEASPGGRCSSRSSTPPTPIAHPYLRQSRNFRCTYPRCGFVEHEEEKMRRHVSRKHLNNKPESCDEEEFYYTEDDDDDELVKAPSLASEPTLSHRDMARPPHEDPEYQKQIVGNFKQGRALHNSNHLSRQQQQASAHHNRGGRGMHHMSTIPSNQQQQLQNNNTSCTPTSHLAHHNYTWPSSSPGANTTAMSSPVSTLNKHARTSSSRPSHSVAPYPSLTFVQHQQQQQQHQHQHSSSSNNSSPVSPVIHCNSSANNMLQQLTQQNVTVTAHVTNGQVQHHLSSVTITPNYHPTQQQHTPHQSQLQHQDQQPSHPHQPLVRGQQQSTASNLVANNNNNNSMPLQHVAVQQSVGVAKHTPNSPNRRTRGENKKCRKVYGMEKRDQWCTQCRWKKACSRFGD